MNGLYNVDQTSTVYVTSAQLKALSSTNPTIIPAVPNCVIVPFRATFSKEAGTAYTLNSVARVSLSVGGIVFGTATAAGFLDQATKQTALTVSTGSQVSAYVLLSASQVVSTTNQPCVLIRESGTDLSDGTGGLVVTVNYRLFPIP